MAKSGLTTSVPKPANQGGHASASVAPTKTAGTPGNPGNITTEKILYSSQPGGFGGSKKN